MSACLHSVAPLVNPCSMEEVTDLVTWGPQGSGSAIRGVTTKIRAALASEIWERGSCPL